MLRIKPVVCAALFASALVACSDGTSPPPRGAGTLVVTASGLPPGIEVAMTLAGQGGTRTIVSGATTTGLAPGSYTLAAPEVGGATAWYPMAMSQPVSVAAADTTFVRVRYARTPAGGDYVPSLDQFDSAMVAYMEARAIGAGSLTISRRGTIAYARGFGWKNSRRTARVVPNTMFRLASLAKPVTSAAIIKLIAEGRISLATKVFEFLELTPAGQVTDSRIFDITVEHLLDHSAGWDRSSAGDPVFKSREISTALGLEAPPTKTQVAQWMMTQPLQFAPGSRVVYCNFGYSLLGLIVEKATGMQFIDYVRQHIVGQEAAAEMIAGRTLPSLRDAREPEYHDPNMACSVFSVTSCVLVPWPDGGWYIEAFDAFGGLVASAPAVARFLESYWMSGEPRSGSATGQDWSYYGSLDGTFTMARQRADGVNIVALFNQRTDPSGLPYSVIQQSLDDVADAIARWP